MHRIGVVGDYQAGNDTHDMIAASIQHHLPEPSSIEVQWLPTDTIGAGRNQPVESFDGVWIAPGSPYRSIDGALAAIERARVGNIPLLGTCGGFQHVALEYARHVLGFTDAAHAEYDPYASRLFVAPLSCSLVGTMMEVRLEAPSRAASAYGASWARERYYCNFGINRAYEDELGCGGLAITGRDADGEARIVELTDHAFSSPRSTSRRPPRRPPTRTL